MGATLARGRARLGRAARLSGRVVDPDGEPVRDAYASATAVDSKIAYGTARTDETGAFTFPPLPPGEIELLVLGKGRAPSERKTVTLLAGEHATVDLVSAPR